MSSTGSCMAIPYSTGERYSSKCPKEINEQLVVREAYKRTSYIRASVVAIWVLQVIEASLEFTPLYDTHNLNRHRFKSGLYGGHKSGATKFKVGVALPKWFHGRGGLAHCPAVRWMRHLRQIWLQELPSVGKTEHRCNNSFSLMWSQFPNEAQNGWRWIAKYVYWWYLADKILVVDWPKMTRQVCTFYFPRQWRNWARRKGMYRFNPILQQFL